ncbi:glycosyl hydrolase [Streptomyces sp. NPDC004838]
MTTGDLDFHLDGFEPADDASELAENSVCADDLTVVAEYNTAANASPSYIAAHDASSVWGVPGRPPLVAIKITWDFGNRTYTFEAASHAGLAFAQNWLVERGCPAEPIAVVRAQSLTPADDLTVSLEGRIHASGDRYEILDARSTDFDPCETWTLVRDSSAVQAPVRVFLEEGNLESGIYTVREGAFADETAAQEWLDNRCGPLPDPPENRSAAATRQTGAALSRSASPAVQPLAGLGTSTSPSTSAPRGTTSRRSM